jgi:ribosomal protein S18 acetylase RimI-like enzyme
VVNTRRATAGDAGWIRSLIPRLHEFGPPGYRRVAQMNDSEAAATTAAIDGGDDRLVIVAEADGVRQGFIHVETATDFFTRERHGHISTIVVLPDAEGRGVGRALLAAAEEWCRAHGYRLLTLHVFEANRAARRLYERAGFAIDTIKYLKVL